MNEDQPLFASPEMNTIFLFLMVRHKGESSFLYCANLLGSQSSHCLNEQTTSLVAKLFSNRIKQNSNLCFQPKCCRCWKWEVQNFGWHVVFLNDFLIGKFKLFHRIIPDPLITRQFVWSAPIRCINRFDQLTYNILIHWKGRIYHFLYTVLFVHTTKQKEIPKWMRVWRCVHYDDSRHQSARQQHGSKWWLGFKTLLIRVWATGNWVKKEKHFSRPGSSTYILRKKANNSSLMPLGMLNIQIECVKWAGFELWSKESWLPNVLTLPLQLSELKVCLSSCTNYIFTKTWKLHIPVPAM